MPRNWQIAITKAMIFRGHKTADSRGLYSIREKERVFLRFSVSCSNSNYFRFNLEAASLPLPSSSRAHYESHGTLGVTRSKRYVITQSRIVFLSG